MAFGGRDLRLFLSIQSYGTGNIQRLRRDIASLSAATKVANASSMQIAQRATQSGAAQVRAGDKLSSLNNRLIAQEAQKIRLAERYRKEINKTYSPQHAARIIAKGQTPKKMLATPMGKALALDQKALTGAIAQTNRQIGRQTILFEELGVTTQRLIGHDLALAQAEEAAALAMQTKIVALQESEIAGRTVAHIGRTIQFAGLLATAGFGVAASAAAGFSKEVGLAATQMRDIGAPISDTVKKSNELSKAILSLMTEFPASSQEMTDSAYAVFSSMNLVHNGVTDVASGLGLLRVANRAAVAGQVSLQEATGAMIPILNNFDPQLRNVGKTMDSVFSIVRFGNIHLDEFAQSLSTLAPIAGAAGISIKNMGGPFATLTLLMPNFMRASAGLGRLFELMRLPAFEKGFRSMGIEVLNANHQLRPLLDIMKDIVKVHPEVATGQKAAIEFFIQVSQASGLTKAGIQGTVQARRAFELLATHLGLFADTQEHVNKNTGEMARAFDFMSKQPGVQWSVLINQMKAFAIVIGTAVLPVFLALGQHISNLITWFENLSSTTKTYIARMGAVVALFLLFSGTVINMVGSMVALSNNLKLMQALAGDTAKKFLTLKLVIASLAFTGIFMILSAFIGLKRAVVDLTVAVIVWKSQTIIAFAAVQVAALRSAIMVAGSWTAAMASVKAATRSALIATGWGALAVAAGLAADYVMTHWDEVRAYFHAWREEWRSGWHSLWNDAVNTAKKDIGLIGEYLGKLTHSSGLESWGHNIRQSANKALIASAKDGTSAFAKAEAKWLAIYAKQRKAKSQKASNDLIKAQKQLFKKLLTEDMLKKLGGATGAAEDAATKAAQVAKARTAAVKSAMEDMNKTIETGVGNLAGIYERFKQINEQGMGDVFGGPTMSGILGGVFGGINDLLRQFGVQIAVPFSILQQDQDQQMTYFKRWRGGLDKLMKRKVPLDMIQSIEKLGPNAIPMIEGLLGANPKQLKKYVSNYKKMQEAVRKAAEADTKQQLADWEKYGNDVAYKMIMGLNNGLNANELNLQKKFKTFFVNTFGNILQKEMATKVAAAMVEAAALADAAIKAGTIPTIPGGPGGGPGKGGKGGKSLAKQNAIARREMRSRAGAFRAMATWAVDPRSPGGKYITGKESKTLNKLEAQRLAFSRRSNIIGQMIRQDRRNPGHKNYNVTYGGDSVTVHADGATVNSVMRALNKAHFRRTNKPNRGRS